MDVCRARVERKKEKGYCGCVHVSGLTEGCNAAFNFQVSYLTSIQQSFFQLLKTNVKAENLFPSIKNNLFKITRSI